MRIFVDLLRKHANVYPGSETNVRYDIDHEHDEATLGIRLGMPSI